MDNPHARCRVYYIYQTICVCMCNLCTQPYAALQLTLCLTLVLGTAITFTLRLWLCSGIALRAQPQRAQGSCSCTAQVQGTHLFLMALHSEWLLNVINLASLRFHVSSLSQRNCFRSCQLQFVTSCQSQMQLQLPDVAFAPRGVFLACRLGHCLGLKFVLTLC